MVKGGVSCSEGREFESENTLQPKNLFNMEHWYPRL